MSAIGYKNKIYPQGSSAAKNSVFDNTGTDLESTNAEDAIKEVDGKVDEVESKVGVGSVSVVADGTKTYGQLLNELWSLVDFSKITKSTILFRNGCVLHIGYNANGVLHFTYSTAGRDRMMIQTVALVNNDSDFNTAVVTSSGLSVVTDANNVAAGSFEIRY